jgi:hypothetical protein
MLAKSCSPEGTAATVLLLKLSSVFCYVPKKCFTLQMHCVGYLLRSKFFNDGNRKNIENIENIEIS